MVRTERLENLARLRGELAALADLKGWSISAEAQHHAERIAAGIPAAHSTSEGNFESVCRSGRLLSPQALHDLGLKQLHVDAVETQLQTSGFVFFYAGPFAFSPSGCGLLYSRSLEEGSPDEGASSPFDSGGLINHYHRSDPAETPLNFLRRHELPLPGHREYLRETLGLLYADPADYLSGTPPRHPGPLGLAGGDRRRWTHEVRIPNEVILRSPHLRAVFVPGRAFAEPVIQAFLEWCVSEEIDVETYPVGRENDFENMARACIEYLTRILP